jgi:hypothetical protein
MNRKYQPSPKRVYFAAALVAVLCSVLLGSAIQGLAGHYQALGQMAAHGQTTVAQR